MNKKHLQIEHLERKFKILAPIKNVTTPSTGWINTVRVTLGMSLQQLAEKLEMTRQSVGEIETREQEGTITLKSLKETADALDMYLVYGLVPKDGTIDALIERKASELALKIVSRTSNTMKLENQENSKERIQKAIEERAAVIKNDLPKMLWD